MANRNSDGKVQERSGAHTPRRLVSELVPQQRHHVVAVVVTKPSWIQPL